MKIGIIGSGVVARRWARAFANMATKSRSAHAIRPNCRNGRRSIRASTSARSPTLRSSARSSCSRSAVGGSRGCSLAGADNLAGKTVIDACNPIGGGPPVNGVLSFFTATNKSLMERLQRAYPDAHFVKAFNSVAGADGQSATAPAARPTMFICGDDAESKKTVARLLDQFGWETEDMGAVEAARAIEPLCRLWCIPGVGKGDWSPHAFKLLR